MDPRPLEPPCAPKGGEVRINGTVRLPLPLVLFLVSSLVAITVWGIRLEGRLNTIQELQSVERTERRLTTVDAQDLLQRVSRLEGKIQ
jgi:hypothetical protein